MRKKGVKSLAVAGQAATNGRSRALPPELMIIKDDPWCQEALDFLRKHGIDIEIIEVSSTDYSSPRGVPKLLTSSGQYVGLDVIKSVAMRELVGGSAQ